MSEKYNKEMNRIRILSGLEPLKSKEEQINEGWLQNLVAAVGLLASTYGAAQTTTNLPYDDATKDKIEQALQNPQIVDKLKEMGVDDNNISRAEKRLKDYKIKDYKTRTIVGDVELAKYLKMGYHLTGVQTDTVVSSIKKIAPQMPVTETVIEFNDNAFFESGIFSLNGDAIQKIKTTIDSLNSPGNILLNIIIESSTDKQGLSKNLQKSLMSIGYSRDNNGLSQARNDAVMKVIQDMNVDLDLVDQVVLSEQGERVIDQSSRYVKIIIQVMNTPEYITSPGDPVIEYPQTFEVIKAFVKKSNHQGGSLGKTCKSSISKFKKGQILCPSF